MKRMTRALCLLLAPLMLLTVVGCSNTPPDKSGNSSTVSSAATSGYPNAESETSSSDSSVSDSTDNSGSNSTTVRTTGNNRSSTNTTAKTTSGNTSDINMKDPQNPYKDIPAKLKDSTVTFLMYWEPNARDKSKFRSFEATTGIKVKYIVSPDVQSKLASLISAGQSPDVVRYSFWPAGIDLLQDLSAAKLNMADPIWDQSVSKATTYKGKIYGVNTFGETAINSYVA